MQTSLLSANIYFTPMASRVQAVDDLQSYRDPRPDWSLLDTEASPAAGRKVPTESDDREDYSSDSERADNDVDGEAGVQSEDGGYAVATVTTIVTAKSLLAPTVSFGDSEVVVVAMESAETGEVGFSFGNGEDGKTEEEGMIEIENGIMKIDLDSKLARGPNGGKAVKPVTGNDHGPGGRRQEPNESTDVEYMNDKPAKFFRPNGEWTVQNDIYYGSYGSFITYDASTSNATTTLRMPMQDQHPRYEPSTYSFPSHPLSGTERYSSPRQYLGPTYPSPQDMYLPVNVYTSVGTQPENRPTVQHQQQLQPSPNRRNLCPEALTATFNQCLNTEGYQQATFVDQPSPNQPQHIVAPSYMPVYQRPGQDQFNTNLRTTLPTGIQEDPILIPNTCTEPQGCSVPTSVPANAQPSSELDIALEWVGEQPETRPTTGWLAPPRLPASSPHSWSETSESSGAPNSAAYPHPYNFPLSSPVHCLQQGIEFTPNAIASCSFHFDPYALNSGISTLSSGLLGTTSTGSNQGIYPGRGLSNPSPQAAQLPTAPSPYVTSPHSVTSSTMETSPQSAHGYDFSDEVGSRSSPGSDCLVTMTSYHGSVSNSPSSVSEDGTTILIGDDSVADKMALVAEAEITANSLDELALISQDPQGDTPLNVAMINEQGYLAEALLRRLIKVDLLRQIINGRNKLQQTPLCLAVICNKPLIVEMLIDNGADVNVHLKASDDYLGPKFCQPLHLASQRGHLWKQTLKKLLRANNIDLNAFNSDGKSALHCAIEGHGRSFKDVTVDCKDTLRMLAEKGANLNQPDCGHEKTPLHYAIERRDVELVSRLLVLAAMSFTPDCDHYSIAKMLEARTGNGNTALHLAASVDMDTGEHKKLIQQLMSKGADPSSKNSDGFLPRELTKNRAIVELLKGRTASGRSPNTDKKRNS